MTETETAQEQYNYNYMQLDDLLYKARSVSYHDINDSIAEYEALLKLKPDWVDVLKELALLYLKNGDAIKTLEIYQRLAGLLQNDGRAWALLGRSHLKTGAGNVPAQEAYEKADAAGYITPRFLAEKAECAIGLEAYEEAEQYLNQALEIAPNSISALHTRSVLLELRGDIASAEKSYRKILKIKPGAPETLYRLSDMGVLSEEDFQYCDINHPVHQKRKVRWQEKSSLGFARGIYLAKQKKHDEAFTEYKSANDIINENLPFDFEELKQRNDRHIEFFNGEFFEKNRIFGSPSNLPVFVVGMPRSGSTLIEQILSSHSRITAGGELHHIMRMEAQQIICANEKSEQYPDTLRNLEYETIQYYADQYFDYLSEYISEDADFIIDKLPHNFLNIGLIKLVFPNSTIIHSIRNPLDTCLSCYLKKFNNMEHLSYTFDLEALGHFYAEYQRMMKHWHSVLPGQILDVQYEDMLDNQEAVSRKMLEHIGVDWEDACLNFHTNKRMVKTASLYQVRQPIYKTSKGRWKRYEKHLAPLINVLKEQGCI